MEHTLQIAMLTGNARLIDVDDDDLYVWTLVGYHGHRGAALQ